MLMGGEIALFISAGRRYSLAAGHQPCGDLRGRCFFGPPLASPRLWLPSRLRQYPRIVFLLMFPGRMTAGTVFYVEKKWAFPGLFIRGSAQPSNV